MALRFAYNDIENFLRPQPDFEVSAYPKLIVLHSWEGSSKRTIATVKSIEGFSANITFEVALGLSLVLSDVRFTFDSPYVNLPAAGEVQCVLALSVCSHISPGEYYIQIIGIAGNLKGSERVTIIVS